MTQERFQKPTQKQLIDLCLLFNDGVVDVDKIADMLGLCNFVVDRLYENGDVTKKSSKEIEDESAD